MRAMTSAADPRVTRRRFAFTAGCALAAAAVGEACLVATNTSAATDGRFAARPVSGAVTSLTSGPLGLGGGDRDGGIQMPSAPAPRPMPLLVFLHGAAPAGGGGVRGARAAGGRGGGAAAPARR